MPFNSSMTGATTGIVTVHPLGTPEIKPILYRPIF